LNRLRGKVFHLTTKKAFEKIKTDGFIFNNKNGRFGLNTSSENSFGREQGWICFFDLRNKSDQDIEETLIRYNFLGPSWFCEYGVEFSEMNMAYLILNSSSYDKLIRNESPKSSWIENKKGMMYIPETECWYPGDLPLSFIKETIVVRIFQDAPKHNRFLYDHHLMAIKNKPKSKGQ